MKKLKETQTKKHLSANDRVTIQTLLETNTSPTQIAYSLNKSPSTITREISKHSKVIPFRSKCLHVNQCRNRFVCGARYCSKLCKECNSKDCTILCSDFEERICVKTSRFVICNGCEKFKECSLEKRIYNAVNADKEYRNELVSKRVGFDLTEEELLEIDNQVTPLIQAGHSPYSAVKTLGDKLVCSESTLYRLINSTNLTVRDIDLPEKVKRKKRNHYKIKNKDAYAKMIKGKETRTWPFYLKYIKNNPACPQMDCVEGKKDESPTLLTMHWPSEHMQLYFIMEKQCSKCVVSTLDKIEIALGTELFMEMFPAILTDNGSEFADIEGMERSVNDSSIKRTHIFFCEPNRSDEKGAAERNHRILRKILPKGSSLNEITQLDATLISNHVNSYVRKTLGGICPYESAMEIYPEDFFVLLGLEKIKKENVILTPDLLKNRHCFSE